MKIRSILAYYTGLAMLLSPVFAFADTALTTSCVGVPATTNILWTASSAGGVAPIAFLWGNSSTSTIQSISVSPGTYNMTIQATDASSTVATSTCSATVNAPATTTPPTTDYRAQIQNILNQIAALRIQLQQMLQQQGNGGNGTGTSTPPVIRGLCLKNDKNLSKGDRGEEVKELQKHLSGDSSLFSSGDITGFFGPKTEKALKKYQEKHGIFAFGSTTTGFFGPMTRGFIRGHCEDRKNDRDENKNASSSLKIDKDDDRDNNGRGNGRHDDN